MEETQSFRLIGTTEIMRIPIQHVDGQNVVYWESIEEVFPGVKCVKNGDVTIPRCIKYYPGVVLDIVSSSACEHLHVDSSAGPSSLVPTAALTPALTFGRIDALAGLPTDPSNAEIFVEGLRVTSALEETPLSDIGTHNPSIGPTILPPSLPSEVKTSSKPALSFMQVVKLASKKANESDGRVQQQELSAKMDHMIKSQEEMNKLQKTLDVKQDEMTQLALDHHDEMTQLQKAFDAKQDEMKQLALDHHEETKETQQRALDQLAVLQSCVQAVLTQTYELHEYPIPRLFVVLPQDPTGWDTMNLFSNKFRLYFLCECGEHTKSINSKTKIPHHIHLAKHEGYEIARPSEFFQQYGSYVLTILKMLKFGISVAGVAVPAISHLISADVIDQVTVSLQQLKDHIEPGMDQVIDYLEKVSLNEGEADEQVVEQMKNKEALEGADLRKLDMFLKGKDENKVLGNLYRTVTVKGHVKWVCIDHYRQNYQENAAKSFRDTVHSLGGTFDENLGRVEVKLLSRVLADQFYSALFQAKSVHDLKIELAWEASYNDLKTLRDTLLKTNVAALVISCNDKIGPASDIFNRSRRYDPVLQIMRHSSIQSFEIMAVPDFFTRTSLQSSNINLSHLRRLKISATEDHDKSESFSDTDIAKLKLLISQAPNLASMSLKTNMRWSLALSETFKTSLTLTTLDLKGNSIGDNGAVALSEALKTNSTLTTLDLHGNSIWFKGLQAMFEALKTNSTLTTLDLLDNSIRDNGAQAMFKALKTNSTLTTLDLLDNSIGDNGAVAL
ncbi:hypothetical protein BGX30_006021, partial [Mortierella sp. GBA39]